MKKYIIGLATGALFIASIASGATVLFPTGGGTGTSTIPSIGQFLMGNGTGIYVPGRISSPSSTIRFTSSTGNIFADLSSLLVSQFTNDSGYLTNTIFPLPVASTSLVAGTSLSLSGNTLNFTDTTGDKVYLPRVNAPTQQTLNDFFRMQSAGRFEGGTITAITSSTFSVSAGYGTIATGTESTSPLVFFQWPALTSQSIATDTTIHVGVEYNGGIPRIATSTSDTWTYQDSFPLGWVVRNGNPDAPLHITNNARRSDDVPGQLIRRFHQTLPYARDELVGGLILGETGTRNITLSTGYLWDRNNRFTIPAINTSISPVSATSSFDAYYRDGSTGFTGIYSTTTWDNLRYDNNTGTLTALGTNKYANHWWYLEPDGALIMMYGRAEYSTAAQAALGDIPSTLPSRLTAGSRLIARSTFQKGASTYTSIDSAFNNVFTPSAVTNHANLTSLDYASAGHTGFQPTISFPIPVASTSLTVTSPLSLSTNNLSMPTSTATQDGFLKATDWVTFNSKITTTSLSVAYPPMVYNSTTGVFSLPTSTASQSGFLSSTDWGTFNGKQAPITLTAGTGIQIASSSPTWTITNGGVQSLVAGSGIGISSATGTVTISNTGGAGTESGWRRTSPYVYLATTTDQIGIGATSSIAKVNILGTGSRPQSNGTGVFLNVSGTYTDTTTAEAGTATNALFTALQAPSMDSTNNTFQNYPATFYVGGAPTNGAQATLQSPYAIWSDSGVNRFDGNVLIGGDILARSPAYDLSFDGEAAKTIGVERANNGTGQALTITGGGGTAGQSNRSAGIFALYGGKTTGTGNSQLDFYTYPAGSTGSSDNSAFRGLSFQNKNLTISATSTFSSPVTIGSTDWGQTTRVYVRSGATNYSPFRLVYNDTGPAATQFYSDLHEKGWDVINNNFTFNAMTAGKSLIFQTSSTNALTIDSSQDGTFADILNVTGNFNVNTNKFNVVGASGNTTITGTLGVNGAVTVTSTLGVTGVTTLGTTNTGALTGTSLSSTGAILSSSSTAGIGYSTGAGCTVIQATSKTTGVTCTGMSGRITATSTNMLAGTEATFTVTNTSIGANDAVIVSLAGTGFTSGSYGVSTEVPAAGSFIITLTNWSSGGRAESIPMNFVVLKGVGS